MLVTVVLNYSYIAKNVDEPFSFSVFHVKVYVTGGLRGVEIW